MTPASGISIDKSDDNRILSPKDECVRREAHGVLISIKEYKGLALAQAKWFYVETLGQ